MGMWAVGGVLVAPSVVVSVATPPRTGTPTADYLADAPFPHSQPMPMVVGFSSKQIEFSSGTRSRVLARDWAAGKGEPSFVHR